MSGKLAKIYIIFVFIFVIIHWYYKVSTCPGNLIFFFPVLKYGIFFPVPTILCRCVSLQTYLIAKCIGGFFHIYLLVDVIITIPYVSFLLSNQYFLLLFKLIWKSYLFWFQHLKVTPNLNIWISPLRANSTKWSNTLKQFVGKLPTNYLSVFWPFCGIGP